MNQKRITSIDFAKATCIFLVVLGHVLRDGLFFSFLVPASVPVFFVLAGMTSKCTVSKDFLKKKARTILIPYLFTASISIIIFMLLGSFVSKKLGTSASYSDFMSSLWLTIYGSSKNGGLRFNRSLWFLPCLFMIFILDLFLEVLTLLFQKTAKNKTLVISRILYSLIICLTGNYIITHFPKLFFPFQLETAMCHLPFFEFGACIKTLILDEIKKDTTTSDKINLCFKLYKKICPKKIVMFLYAITLFSVGTVLCVTNGITSSRTDEYGNYVLFFLCSCFFAISFLLFGNTFSNITAFWNYVGRNTLQILCWNKFPIIMMQTLITPLGKALKNTDSIKTLAICIIPSIITLFICLIIGEIQKKILPITLGINKKSGHQ